MKNILLTASLLLLCLGTSRAQTQRPSSVQPVLIAGYLEREQVFLGEAGILHVFISNQSTSMIQYDYALVLLPPTGNPILRDSAVIALAPGDSVERVLKIISESTGIYRCIGAIKSESILPSDAVTGFETGLNVTEKAGQLARRD